MPGTPTAARVEPQSDEDITAWLTELVTCHRPSPDSSGASSGHDAVGAAFSKAACAAEEAALSKGSACETKHDAVLGSCAGSFGKTDVLQTALDQSVPCKRTRSPDLLSLPLKAVRVPEPVVFKLCGASHAGAVLHHASDVIKNLQAKGPLVFKVGVTKDPIHRWSNVEYGYKFEKAYSRKPLYERMLVLIEVDSSQAAGFAEAALIAQFYGQNGCMNRALGGEGIGQNVPCKHFIYVVYGYSM